MKVTSDIAEALEATKTKIQALIDAYEQVLGALDGVNTNSNDVYDVVLDIKQKLDNGEFYTALREIPELEVIYFCDGLNCDNIVDNEGDLCEECYNYDNHYQNCADSMGL